MSLRQEKFKVLLCGTRECMEIFKNKIVKSEDIHFQYSSSPNFVVSRALFNPPHVVILDTAFKYSHIRDLVTMFRSEFTDISVVMMSTSSNNSNVGKRIHDGATDVFDFPDDSEKLNCHIQSLLEQWQQTKLQPKEVVHEQRVYDFSQIIGSAPKLIETLNRARKIIDNPSLTVLITGESGTGKETLACAIHYNSIHSNGPFIVVSCSALSETLLESELFGFEKGAFTDARECKAGLFELATGGTIFLDEIGDISLAMQSKLLKVVESRLLRRLGRLHDIPFNARIVATTSSDLEEKVKSGRFRKDLYHRLKIIPLEMPPLRHRREDIPVLTSAFVASFNKLYNKNIKGISSDAIQILMEYEWEGNIRELKYSVERAIILADNKYLSICDFDFLHSQKPEFIRLANLRTDSALSQSSHHHLVLNIPLEEASLEEVQRKLVRQVLEHLRGNKSKAAYVLRISRPRLDRILKSAIYEN